MRTVVIGGTSGIGLEVARDRAARGDEVVLTGRDRERAAEVAESVEGDVAGPGARPQRHARAGRRARRRRQRSTGWWWPRSSATRTPSPTTTSTGRPSWPSLKLVGYTEVIHALLPRMNADSSVVLFGGRAKDRPYPGSITVSTVNGGVVGLVNALALEMAPIRVNALHPGIVGDSPFWSGKPEGVLDGYVARTPTGRLASMADIVDGGELPAREPRRQRHQPVRRRRVAGHVTPPRYAWPSSAPAGWAARWPAGSPRPDTR